jgi:methylase of polypeptide subunit release factors
LGHGRDASAEALAVAAGNADRLGLAARASFSLGDWGEGLTGPFDLVLCNPPYVEEGAHLPPGVRDWEPAAALYAGADGLDDYRRIAPEIARLLSPQGLACVEIGATQATAAGALFEAQGLGASVRKDLADAIGASSSGANLSCYLSAWISPFGQLHSGTGTGTTHSCERVRLPGPTPDCSYRQGLAISA